MKLITSLALALLFASSAALAQLLAPPQTAIELAQASPLEFVGTYVPHGGSGRISACVFRNDYATVIYEYCTVPEAPATAIRIYPAGAGSSVRYYLESDTEPSQTHRRDYEEAFWSVSSRAELPEYRTDMSPAELRDYEQAARVNWACTAMYIHPIGEIFTCNHELQVPFRASADAWLQAAKAFWVEPPVSWYEFLGELRVLVDQHMVSN
jgi:hypothetical protein